jgi:hypothetical protein
MKKVLFTIALCALVAAPALADLGDVTKISLQTTTWTYYGGTGGGEFHATVIGLPLADVGPINSTWETFCLEENETVGSGTHNYFGVVNTAAVKGGDNPSMGSVAGGNPIYGDPLGQQSVGDPLDARTAYLFTKFSQGTLLNYDFAGPTAARKADAAALQDAIWKIEQEITKTLTGQALAWYNEATTAVASGAWQGIGDVRVLNLYTGYTANTVSGAAQDVLVMVPVPAAVLLGFLGLGAAGIKLRRFA